MAVTRSAASAPAARADLACAYRSCDIVVEPRQVLLGQLAHALLEALGAEGDFAVLSEVYAALPGTLFSALRETEDLNGSIATALADEVITYVLAAGPNYGSGYALAMCSLMERQWKHAACFHAGEFLHGACEMLTPQQAAVLLLGEDATRPIAERARDFLREHTAKAHCIDSRELSLPGVPGYLRGEFAPIALTSVASRLARHLEAVREHTVVGHRYMVKPRC
ncbi:hypothetical protein ABZ752_35285 [Streptomyces roseifaciens]